MFVVDLVDADQHALLVLPHIGEALEVDGHRHLEIGGGHFGDRIGDKIVVLERRQRQFDPGHPADLLGPEPGGVDHMFASDRAPVGHDLPTIGGLVQSLDLGVLVVFRAALFR